MPTDSQALLALFVRAAEDVFNQPAVRARLASLLRDVADELEAPPEASHPAPEAILTPTSAPEPEPESEGILIRVPDPASGDGIPQQQEAIPSKEEEPDEQLDAEVAIRLLREGMGENRTVAHGVFPVNASTLELHTVQKPGVSLNLLSQRLSLKAETCKVVGAASPVPKTLSERAQKLNTSLWMIGMGKPERLDWMQHLGLCFEAGAEAALLLEQSFAPTLDTITHRHRDVVDAAAHATALTLSATFRMLEKPDINADPDVRDLHRWLEYLTNQHQIFQDRYMKLNALPSLTTLPEAQKKLAHLRDPRGKAERQLISGLRAYLKQIAAENPDSLARKLRENRFLEKVETAKELGWQPSRLELRKLLSTWYDALPRPEHPSPFYAQLLEYVDDQYREIPPDETEEDEEELQPSKTPNIDRVRDMLQGKALYIVGGNPVPAAMERIKKSFALKEVIWPHTSPSSSVESLRATVSRPDVAAVLLLVRFSSHTFGQLIEDCERARKPFVRIPSGYGVKQIAYQILHQASQQLA